jgi:hypothetical protein
VPAEAFQPVRSRPLKMLIGAPQRVTPSRTSAGARTPVKEAFVPFGSVIEPLTLSSVSVPSTTRSPAPCSHCGGMANRNVLPVNVTSDTGRALPPLDTNAPTSDRLPDSFTSIHEG